jgi:3' terminal RNA ribose 2'-O-methyltransferase Hen1
MLLISTTHQPATDLGYLLHKNPSRMHSAEVPFGNAQLVFPEASHDRCSAALVVEIDSVKLVRGSQRLWSQYVNDRPYVASSFLAVAIRSFFATAMTGRCKERPELAQLAIPLEFRLPAIKVRGGMSLLEQLFVPLGYELEASNLPQDPNFPEWGRSDYFDLRLKGTLRLVDALNHLFVLIPVLDDEKHYYVGEDEVAKLLRKGGEWLASHPSREEITRRYLKHKRHLTRDALARLAEFDGQPDPDAEAEATEAARDADPVKQSLHSQRLDEVAELILASGASRVLDLGCGEGRLLERLIRHSSIRELVGMDVSLRSLEKVKSRLRFDRLAPTLQNKLNLVHGSLTYRDRELTGFHAAALVEVIEHMDEGRLEAMERTVFRDLRPEMVVVTTPNQEYNVLFEGMAEGAMRHGDHRFEWTRAEFAAWAERVASAHGYVAEIRPIGEEHPEHGAPSQMAVFRR